MASTLEKTEKQTYEKYFIFGNFSSRMATGETIDTYVVTCRDKDGINVTSSLIESGSEYVDGHRLYVRIQNGIETLDPYVFTIRIVTNIGNKWEIDGRIIVKET